MLVPCAARLHLTAIMDLTSVLIFAGVMGWLAHLGGFGLILMGLADNSVVPMPGSMDVLTIWLAASNPHRWYYYAIMAIAGFDHRRVHYLLSLAAKGGKEAMERKLSRKSASKVYRRFERWGFWAVAIPALAAAAVSDRSFPDCSGRHAVHARGNLWGR